MAQLSTTMSQAHRATAFHCPGQYCEIQLDLLIAYLLDLELLLITDIVRLGNRLALGGASSFLHLNVRHVVVGEGRFGNAWRVEAGVGVTGSTGSLKLT